MDLAGTAKDEEKELFKGGAIRELFKEDALGGYSREMI